MDPIQREAWVEHWQQWRHCVRCRLANWRLRSVENRLKRPTPVPIASAAAMRVDSADYRPPTPYPWAILLSYPDDVQSFYATVHGNANAARSEWSPQISSLYKLASERPQIYSLEQTPITFAQSCFPVNWKRTQDAASPSKQLINACRTKWVVELALCEPRLVLVCGHWAFAAAFPDTPKKTDYHKSIGECLPLTLTVGEIKVQTHAYITVSPLTAFSNSTRAQWQNVELRPPRSALLDPVGQLRWDIYRAQLLCHALETGKIPSSGDPWANEWRNMVLSLNEHHDAKASVVDAVHALQNKMRRIHEAESSTTHARDLQSGRVSPDDVPAHLRVADIFSRKADWARKLAEEEADELESESDDTSEAMEELEDSTDLLDDSERGGDDD